MAKIANKMYDIDGNIIEIEPTSPTEDTRGGFYANSVDDTSNMNEVVLGEDGKGYVETNYKYNYKVDELTDNEIDAKFVYDNFELGYTYRYDGDYSIFSEASGTLGTYHNPIITCVARYETDNEISQIIEVQSINTDIEDLTNPAEIIVVDKYVNVTTLDNINFPDGFSLLALIESHNVSSGGSADGYSKAEIDAKFEEIEEKINQDALYSMVVGGVE